MRQLFLQSKPVSEALRQWIDRFANCEFSREFVPVNRSLGRVLATPVFAVNSSPHYAAAAMDGFAVVSMDTRGAAPGYGVSLIVGENCFPVDTGDQLPAGTDAVIMIENVLLISAREISIEQPVAPWQHVRPVGEDIVATEMLLPRHTAMRPIDVGACIAAGVTQVEVFARPMVGLIPTGDEIVPPGTELKAGSIVDYNSQIATHMLTEWGGVPRVFPITPDDPSAIRQLILQALPQVDLLIVIAGSSAGRGDFTAEIIAELGEVMTHGVAMRPGKPVIMGEINGKPVFGLPGYPVSAHLCLEQFIKPLLNVWQHGYPVRRDERILAKVTRPVVSPIGLEEHVRVRAGFISGEFTVTPLNRGAGVLTSLVKADGQFIIPPNSEGVMSGDMVSVNLTRNRQEVEASLVAIGSHDPALDVLDDILRAGRKGFLSSSHVGSMGGIIALRKRECHFAGIHLLETDSGVYNIPFAQRYFTGRSMTLVNLADRWQGFMVRPGDDELIDWSSLARLRFVNRQKGSGTRLLLDYHLDKVGVDPQAVRGYEREETTHLAVACAVLSGEADVGLGVRPAADAMGLRFIPLCLEQFDLLIDQDTMSEPRMQELLNVVRSGSFAQQLNTLGGYSTLRSGQIVWEGGND